MKTLSAPLNTQPSLADDFLTQSAVVVDGGRSGWRLAGPGRKKSVHLIGLDKAEPPQKPAGVEFASMRGFTIDCADDVADVKVARHILEHLVIDYRAS